MNISFLCLALFLIGASARPQIDSLVTTIKPSTVVSDKENGDSQYTVPKIYKMFVHSKVANRFANTTITSNVKNLGNSAQEATFAVVLPERAYITGFIMEINNKNYTAYVQEKKQAKATYDNAVSSGLGAAHVEVSARDSNRFTVSVNIEPATKATFYLTYEELLKRKSGYEIVINIHPNQPVPHLEVQVDINESSPLKHVSAPSIRSGNDIRKSEGDLDPRATINKINATSTTVIFNPNEERQKQLAHALGTKENEGLSGQFVVQYDVERDVSGGEILLKDGYFVHFFSPDEIELLPKYVLFVLDTSGSMYDRKIKQLKEAMNSVLSELKPEDSFSIIEFNSNVIVWNIKNKTNSLKYPKTDALYKYEWDKHNYDDITFPEAFAATKENIEQAKNIVNSFAANGGTNIYEALKIALHLYDLKKKSSDEFNKQPLVIFLTDGEPNIAERDPDVITSKISQKNSHSIPIFSLSFGSGADKNFLRKLSLQNSAFSRHIYEAADASLQLEDFYKQISSPLLKNIHFKYTQNVTSLTKTFYPVYYRGSEYVVAGFGGTLGDIPQIECSGIHGPIMLKPKIKESVGELERLWAYLTIQQLLETKEIAKNSTEYEKKALDLALRYSFVTPVSSLVVVKPNATSSVDTEEADKKPDYNRFDGANFQSPYAGVQPLLIGGYQSRLSFKANTYFDMPPSTTVKFISNTLQKLLNELSWLSSILGGDEITLKGVQYKLGIDETVNETTSCLNAPNNATGHCKLLYNCEAVTKNNILTTTDVYEKHFCHIGEYAGICCPVVS